MLLVDFNFRYEAKPELVLLSCSLNKVLHLATGSVRSGDTSI